jgi:ribulose-phosphate 3-epimerase
MVEVLPSILSADFAHLADDVAAAERGGAKTIHVDVMDGHFVPNLSLGFPVIQSLRKATKLTLDCHLMIENPDQFIPDFAEAGANWVSVHFEACRNLHRTLQHIRDHGMEPAVVINPATPVAFLDEVLPLVHHVLVMSVNPGFGGQKFIPFALDKISLLKKIREERNLSYRIEVDGGVDHETIKSVVQAGADLLVAGNAVFGKGDGETATRELTLAALEAAGEAREAGKRETVGTAR